MESWYSPDCDVVNYARNFAIGLHQNKYGEHDYVYHLDQVAEIVRPFGVNFLVVAYLHDLIEDTCITSSYITAKFNEKTAIAVEFCTDERGKNRAERKLLTNKKLWGAGSSEAGQVALVVKAADRLANARECVKTGNDEKYKMYQREHAAFYLVAHRPNLCNEIWQELDSLLKTENGRILSRLELREEVYPRGVLQVCQDVHMTTTGSLERSQDYQRRDMKLLQTVIKTWDPTNECEYDRQVKMLVAITLVEAMP